MDPQDRLFGEIAVRLQLLSREQVAACMKAQQADVPPKRIGDVAFALGHMSREDVDLVLSHQQRVLDRRREAATSKRGSISANVVEESAAAKRDRRTDSSVEVAPALQAAARAAFAKAEQARAAEPAQPTSAAPEPPKHGNTMQLGKTLIAPAAAPAVPTATVMSAPPPPPGPQPSAAPSARDETRPVAERHTNPDDYEFGEQSKLKAATVVGGLRPPVKPAVSGATMMQASGAASRAPEDRAWRNPSRPPPAPDPSVLAAAALQFDNVPPRTGTLVFPPAPEPRRGQSFAPKPESSGARQLDELLHKARDAGASDLHVHAGAPVMVRIDGELEPLSDATPLTAAEAARAIAELLTDAQWETLARIGELRFAYQDDASDRCRAQLYRQERGLSAVFRVLPREAPLLEELTLPARLLKLADVPRGLVLCSGPAGSGKSTTLAALLRTLTENRAAFAVSVEQPIELVHTTARGLCVQVEAPTHVRNLADGIELALAQGAQLIALSDLADAETARAALRAVDAGACVLATLAADSSVGALRRLLELLGPEQAGAVADALRLIIHQVLVPQAVGRGRVPAVEIVPCNSQIAEALRDHALGRITELMLASKAGGITSQRDALRELVNSGVITERTAQR